MNSFYALFLAAVAVASFGQILLKKGAAGERPLWRQYANAWVLGGYLLFALSLGLNSVAYRGVPLKDGPVIESLGFVLVPVMSRLFFKERITPSRFWGFALIIAGVALFVS